MSINRTCAQSATHAHDALRCIARQLQVLPGSHRNFSTSWRSRAAGQEGDVERDPAKTSQAQRPDFNALLSTPSSSSSSSSPASTSTASSSTSSKSTAPPPFSQYGQRARQSANDRPSIASSAFGIDPGMPYKLHAHCSKHNTILALTKDLPVDAHNLKDMYGAYASGQTTTRDVEVDEKTLGQTVLRASPGLLGLRKAQRGTFEAATRASLQMFNLIRQLGTKDRTTKHGRKIRDAPVSTLELVLKGFGQGREALVAALASAGGEEIKRKIRRITDATPIKIGGTRPKKRRKLSPPLDLGRRRR